MDGPFDVALAEALSLTGWKSWGKYWRVWWMKALWNLASRKFQALMFAVAVCLYMGGDLWLIAVCVGGYAGINVVDKIPFDKIGRK